MQSIFMQPISPLADSIYKSLKTITPFISPYDENTRTNIISKLFQPLGNEFCEVLYKDKTFSIENIFWKDVFVVSKDMPTDYTESFFNTYLKYCPAGRFDTYDYIVVKNYDVTFCLKEDVYTIIPKGESFYFVLQNMIMFGLPFSYPKTIIDPKIEKWAFRFVEKWNATAELALHALDMYDMVLF